MLARMRALPFLLVAVLLGACASAGNRPYQLVSAAGPTYPAEARAAGVEGKVLVRYDIGSDGAVENARIESAEPPGVFDAAALATVRAWKFHPQMVKGEPQAVRDIVSTVTFSLHDNGAYDDY
jgi:protein TonB